MDTFPVGGLSVRWRTPVNRGYAGPAVAGGRVFVTDARQTTRNRAIERAIALDESTGRVLWTREWETDYTGLQSPTLEGSAPPTRWLPDAQRAWPGTSAKTWRRAG